MFTTLHATIKIGICEGRTARTLWIHKTMLFHQMKKLGITPLKQDGRNRPNKKRWRIYYEWIQ
ncbi:MAG: hypothetical protein JW902_10140 [Syntrophaceae bacterium]|nr:hypothetical protein [Syntrophaceae bacterium]